MGKLNLNAGKSILDGTPTSRIGVGGTDLGFLFEGNKGQWVGGLFGDTFNGFPNEGGWRSPVMMRTSNRDFNTAGIKWDNAARGGGKLLTYPMGIKNGDARRRDQGCFSIIPNDAIQLPDGHYMGMGFRVKNWDADASQAMCHTHSNTWFHSTGEHAEVWNFAYDVEKGEGTEKGLGYQWWNEGRDQYFQNATFLMAPNDDNVYVFGTPEGRHFGLAKAGVYLRRCDWRHTWERSKWEFWGYKDGKWQWGRDVWPTKIIEPTMPGSSIGEISAQYLGGKVRLTYMDGTLGAVCRTADAPDAVWSDPVVMIDGITSINNSMYAPSLHPWNTDMANAAFNISSWPHAGDSHLAYGTYTYTANIEPAEPLAPANDELRSVSTQDMNTGDSLNYLSRLLRDAAERLTNP